MEKSTLKQQILYLKNARERWQNNDALCNAAYDKIIEILEDNINIINHPYFYIQLCSDNKGSENLLGQWLTQIIVDVNLQSVLEAKFKKEGLIVDYDTLRYVHIQWDYDPEKTYEGDTISDKLCRRLQDLDDEAKNRRNVNKLFNTLSSKFIGCDSENVVIEDGKVVLEFTDKKFIKLCAEITNSKNSYLNRRCEKNQVKLDFNFDDLDNPTKLTISIYWEEETEE